MQSKILIHTALFAEAKTIIEFFKLQCLQNKPYKIYAKDDILLVVLGMGKDNTVKIKELFENYDIKRAINVGIAGCKDTNVEIGSLFCTNHKLTDIKSASLTTVDKPLSNPKKLDTMLVDMEAKTFLHVSKQYLHAKDIYILKIVSDHLDTTIPKKEFVWKIIEKNLKNISTIVTLKN